MISWLMSCCRGAGGGISSVFWSYAMFVTRLCGRSVIDTDELYVIGEDKKSVAWNGGLKYVPLHVTQGSISLTNRHSILFPAANLRSGNFCFVPPPIHWRDNYGLGALSSLLTKASSSLKLLQDIHRHRLPPTEATIPITHGIINSDVQSRRQIRAWSLWSLPNSPSPPRLPLDVRRESYRSEGASGCCRRSQYAEMGTFQRHPSRPRPTQYQ